MLIVAGAGSGAGALAADPGQPGSLAPAGPTAPAAPAPAPGSRQVQLTPAQLFAAADAARDAGNFAFAEQAYRALANDPNPDLRAEARFRLALMLADRQHKYREAAVELRRLLDEKPGSARARLELARIDAQLGQIGSARRELRAAQASGLPPAVERAVRFYSAALQAARPIGGSLEVSLAPDSNINRSTRANTLGTVLGDFTLNQDARARSGLGLALRGQGWGRLKLDDRSSMLLRVSTSADLYKDPQFRDVSLAIQAGPELRSGTDRLALSLGPSWRWYGTDPYSRSFGGEASLLHPLGTKAQGRIALGVARTINLRNDAQTATGWSLSTGVDRALSARFGMGLSLFGLRDHARDPGWSDAAGGLSAYAWREAGRNTYVLTLGYSRLEADARLALFPRRRVDDRFTAVASVTWRALQWRGFAPLTRVRWERNRSTLGLYDYRRVEAEIGIGSAF